MENFLLKKIQRLVTNNIKLKIIGDKSLFSSKLKKLLKVSEKKTAKNNKLQINIALNYGSKNEIINAINQLNKQKKKISINNIENNLYKKYP